MDLLNRALFHITGTDGRAILQKLVTQDLTFDIPAHYTLLLSPQGRYLFDFFVATADDGSLYLDAPAHQANDLQATLEKYKLRSDFKMTRLNPVSLDIAFASPDSPALLAFADPRHSALGWRIWRGTKRYSEAESPHEYKIFLTRCGIIEPSHELRAGHDLPLEFGMLSGNAISFAKGCYVGQEITSRTAHKHLIKHRILLVNAPTLIAHGTPVCDRDGAEIGTVFRSTPPAALVRVNVDANTESGVVIAGEHVATQSLLGSS